MPAPEPLEIEGAVPSPVTDADGEDDTMKGAVVTTGEDWTFSQSPSKARQGLFQWRLAGVTRRQTKAESEWFEIAGTRWRLMVYPRGNSVESLSVFLVVDKENRHRMWSVQATFSFAVVRQVPSSTGEKASVVKATDHRFTTSSVDWGFNEYMPLSDVYDAGSGFVVDDTLVIEVTVSVVPDNSSFNYLEYDSFKETGMVGLRNQGATCYMNSLLQSLFHTHEFRRGVYLMDTPSDQDQGSGGGGAGSGNGSGNDKSGNDKSGSGSGPSKAVRSIPYALQKVFYRMQTSEDAPSTKELTKSFGWDSVDAFTQHDVQEFNRVLVDNLEEKMKGTPAEGLVSRLYSGTILNYIECVNVDYSSKREENFFDLQLLVKGCADLTASLDDYVEVEKLEGDNKYMAEGHGLQDARKGCLFLKLPPVLTLHLRRFEYDPFRDDMVKVNDRYEFPEFVELGEYLHPSVRDADGPRQRYHLFSVLVHSGDVSGGHYYAFVRPQPLSKPDGWYKFDDDRVTRSTRAEAVDDNFGGDLVSKVSLRGVMHTHSQARFANAYMLVYLREEDIPQVQRPITIDDVPPALMSLINADLEREAQRRKEREESHLFITVRCAGPAQAQLHTGHDLVDWDTHAVKIKIRRTARVADARLRIARAVGLIGDGSGGNGTGEQKNGGGGGAGGASGGAAVPDERDEAVVRGLRMYNCVARRNHTIRPDVLVCALGNSGAAFNDDTPFETAVDLDAKSGSRRTELNVFVEVAGKSGGCRGVGQDGVAPFVDIQEEGLIVLKWYDPNGGPGGRGALSYVGTCIQGNNSPMRLAESHLRKLRGLPDDHQLLAFEEISLQMVEPVNLDETPKKVEIGHGDVLVFQDVPRADGRARNPTVKDYVAYLASLRTICVYPLGDRSAALRDPVLTVPEFSLDSPAIELADRVADAVGAKRGHVRLVPTSHPETRLARSGVDVTHMFGEMPKKTKHGVQPTSNDDGDVDMEGGGAPPLPPPATLRALHYLGSPPPDRPDIHRDVVTMFYEELPHPIEAARGKVRVVVCWHDHVARTAALLEIENSVEDRDAGSDDNNANAHSAAAVSMEDTSGGNARSEGPTPGEIAKEKNRRKKAIAAVTERYGPKEIVVFADRGATVGDVEALVAAEIGGDEVAGRRLRFCAEDLTRHFISRVFKSSDPASTLAAVHADGLSPYAYASHTPSPTQCVRVEPVPEEQLPMHVDSEQGRPPAEGGPRMVQIVHVEKGYNGAIDLHGVPFFMLVGGKESIRGVRERVARAIGMTPDVLACTKSSFVEVVPRNSHSAITDRTVNWPHDDVPLFDYLKPTYFFGINDKKKEKEAESYKYTRVAEKAIKIYN